MATWTDIFDDVDGSPVRGVASEFRTVRDHFQQMEEDATAIAREFDRFRDDGQATGSLEGDAGDAFARFIDEVGGELDDVPRVAGDAADIFDHHAGELDRLLEWAQEGTDSALARARTAWTTKHDLEDDAEALRRQVSQLRGQADAAEDAAAAPDPDPTAAGEADDLNGQLGSAADSLRRTEEAIAAQERVLRGIRGEWDDIRGDEERLISTTVDGLDGIDLGDLEDPGWFESIVGSVAGFVGVVLDIALGPLDELVAAALNGDWATFFWELKEALDTVLLALAVVALFFPLTAPLVAAIFIISVVAFAVTAGLYATQTPNPETGETVGLGDVLISGAGVLLAGAGGAQALRAARGLPTSFTPKSGLQSLVDTGGDFGTVLSGGDDAAAAARRLGIRTLPIPAGTPLSQSIPHLLTSPGGAVSTIRYIRNVNGAMPPGMSFLPGHPSTMTNIVDRTGNGSIIDGVGMDAGASPNPDVFTQIALRQRFDPPLHWSASTLPQQIHIIPAN